MKIAVPAKGRTLRDELDPRFGRAQHILIVDSDTMDFTVISGDHMAHGAGIASATAVVNAGAEVVIAGNLGPKAFRVLKVSGLEIFVGAEGRIAGVIAKYKRGELKQANEANCPGGLGGKIKA